MARKRKNRRVVRRRRGQGLPGVLARLDSPQLRRALWSLGAIALCCVLSINSAVRTFGGGNPALLSPLYLPQKTRALVNLAWHSLWHGAGCEDRISQSIVIAAARRNRVPEALALAVARSESSLHAHVISSTGAMGVMQLMPGTAAWLGVHDAFDPAENCDGGTRYLAWLSRRYGGDRSRLVAAYNAGPGSVPQRGAFSSGAETRAYVSRVLGQSRSLASMQPLTP